MSSEGLQVAAVVAFYMAAALVVPVLNAAPDVPLLFLFFQMLIAVLLLHTSAAFSSRIVLPTHTELTLAQTKKLTPVVLVNIIGLVFNTLCLRDVDASFFQIARGLVLPMTIAVSSLTTRTHPTLLVLLCATIVTLGFLIGVLPTSFFTLGASAPLALPDFSSAPTPHASKLLSLLYGILSSLSIAVHAVLIKTSLPHLDGSTIKLAWWTNAGSALFLVPFILFTGELGRISSMLRYGVQLPSGAAAAGTEAWRWGMFAWGTAVTGVFGFLLCVAGLLSIKVTSPITHMFSSAARGVLQTLLAVWIFSDILTVSRASSIFVILFGTV
ncbi:hypothetical protein K439DRAFT_1643903 [Ramaria rubella]|nr:hypothetical protein K439DRAFT_1643903 [Ramaria rubella]